MHLISLVNYANRLIDLDYDDAVTHEDSNDELGNIYKELEGTGYDISIGNHQTIMSPTHYESYLQIYGDPETAVRQYARFSDLKGRQNDLEGAEKKEFQKLKRIDDLAYDFDRSHRYMIEKGSYSQQDVDYAFSLSKKEMTNDMMGEMFRGQHTTGRVYQSLIYQKIFSGMKERYLSQITTKEQGEDIDTVKTWLDNELTTCVNRKKDDFIAVIRGIYRSIDLNLRSPEVLDAEFRMSFADQWITRIFEKGDRNGPLSQGANFILSALSDILEDNQSPFRKTLTGISRFVFAEEEQAKDDDMQKARKQGSKKNKK